MAQANTTGACAPSLSLYPILAAFLLGVLMVLCTPAQSLAEEPVQKIEITETVAATSTKDLLGTARHPTSSMVGQITKGLVYCVAALLVILGLFHRFGPTKGVSGARITVISQRALTSKHSLILAEVEGKKLLLGTGGDQLALLREFEDEAAQEEKSSKNQGAISVAVNNG